MVLLGTATFFEGYDAAINAVVLRDLAISFGVPLERTSTLGGPIVAIGLGAFGALFVTALGDRWGRRPLLIGTTLLYALFTGLTASAQSLLQFTIFQFFARMFLIAELATAITVVAEEFPAARRGRALGVLTAFGALGLPVVALTHFLLGDTRLGWRWLYLIGLLPLVLVAFLRLKLKETERWSQTRKQNETMKRMPLRQVLGSQYRPQFIQVSALFFLTHVALLGALVWWRWFAQEERGFSDQTVTVMLTVGYLLGITGYLVAGFLQDRIGRRRTGAIFLVCGATFGLGVFQSSDASAMLPLLVLAVFFGVGVTPVTNALAAELFPTEMRATAVAFARSVFGTLGAIAGPLLVAVLADQQLGIVGNVGDSVSLVALIYLPAAVLTLRMPETARRELEAISASATIPEPTAELAYEPARFTLAEPFILTGEESESD